MSAAEYNLVHRRHLSQFSQFVSDKHDIEAPILHEDASTLTYQNKKALPPKLQAEKKKLHKGQRKLLLAEVQHLANCLDSKDSKAIVYYMGAGPGEKAYLIHELFPNVKFVFVDPCPFDIKIAKNTSYQNYVTKENYNTIPIVYLSRYGANNNIPVKYYYQGSDHFGPLPSQLEYQQIADRSAHDEYINYIRKSDNRIFIEETYGNYVNAYFANKLFGALSEDGYTTVFWSDVRSKGANNKVGNDNVLYDNCMNMIYLHTSKPDYAMVKFRQSYGSFDKFGNNPTLPFPTIRKYCLNTFGIDIKEMAQNNTMPFFVGAIHRGCWMGAHSSESRIHLTKNEIRSDNIELYNGFIYENSCYTYNMINRLASIYHNPFAGRVPGMDNTADCAIEGAIWNKYATKYNTSIDHIFQRIEDFLGLKRGLNK